MILGTQLQQANRPLAADDALDHRGDLDLIVRLGFYTRYRVASDHFVTTLPKSAFLTPADLAHRVLGDEAQPSAPNPAR